MNYQWPKKLFRSSNDWGDYRFLSTEAELKKTIASLKDASDGFETLSESNADVFELEQIGPDGDKALYSKSSEWIKVCNRNSNPVAWQEESLYLTISDTFHSYDPEDPEDVENFENNT